MPCRFFCTVLFKTMGEKCAPATPAFPPPGIDESYVAESCLDNSDFEGSADCEKGVVGEVMPAEVLAPSLLPLKDVDSCRGCLSVEDAGVGGLWRTERAM
jgi:hypothetical protein